MATVAAHWETETAERLVEDNEQEVVAANSVAEVGAVISWEERGEAVKTESRGSCD